MQVYLQLLRDVLERGARRDDRTGTGCLSIFGYQMRFPLQAGFPLLTTKQLHLPSIVHELLWFLRGESHIDYLRRHKVRIWDLWADKDGHLGPIYGVQWRRWPISGGGHIDQVQDVIEQIKENPYSRRLLVSAWNVAQLHQMALPPCHLLFQFYVQDGRLSCQLYQRSADVFLGLPFNIASYSLLTMMVAQLCGLQLGEFVHTIGDAHLYLNHIEQAKQQLGRTPYALPQLHIKPRSTIDEFMYEDFSLEHYQAHPHIKAEVSV